MPAPRQHGAEAPDEPPDPRTRARRPPQRYHDGFDPICQPDNPPAPAAVPKPAVRQKQRRQLVDSEPDAKFIDINDHSEVDEDDVDETEKGVNEAEKGVERPIPRVHAPRGHALPSPMNTVNSIDQLDSAGSKGARDVNYFFDRNAEGATCRICKLVFLLHAYLSI